MRNYRLLAQLHLPSLPAKCLAITALLSGCTVGPNYQPPNPKLPNQWLEAPTSKSGENSQALTTWWQGFNDSNLNGLIKQTLHNNLDLQAVNARLSAARAQRKATQAERWPELNVTTAYQRQRISPNALLGALGSIQNGSQGDKGDGLLSTLGPIGTPFDLFQAGFDSTWELDLFGGVKRQLEVADANSAALEENRRDIEVTLSAETARLYLELTAWQRRLAIANQQLDNHKEIVHLLNNAFSEGFAAALEVNQAKAELNTAKATIPVIAAQIKNTRHALALLAGLQPGGLDHKLANAPASIPAPPHIQVGIPSDLLRRRPDIRKAERIAAAASAAIGVAVAELFPKFSLTGTVGFQSQELSNFTNLSSGFYGFGPRISLPIFQAGRLSANVESQKESYQEALAIYDKTVLTALREVEDSLVTAKAEEDRKKSLQAAEQSAHDAAGIAAALYTEGKADFLTVLNARRAWHNASDLLAQTDLAWSTSHIALFKALGGGWAMKNAK